MMNITRISWIIGFLLITASCGGSSSGGGGNVTPEVEAAMENAANVDDTIYFSLSSGSIEGLLGRIDTAFSDEATLINGGSSARDAMLAYFTGNPSYTDDTKLALFAYALEQMGDSDSLSTLKSFLEDNIGQDLYITPQFVAHAIKGLSGESVSYDLFYSPSDMRSLTASASISAIRKATATRLSCARQYEVIDAQGKVLTYVDDKGETEEAVITGFEYTTSALSDEESDRLKQEVADGGGTYVTDNSEFRGSPSGQFNCAGYAFRSLNGDKRWRLDPAKTFEVLTKTGALVEVSESEAKAGDKVFYFQSSDATYPGHVAEVERIESGIISNTVIIRNADNNTGLWEAPINATYFTGSWTPWSTGARYPTRKVYRWAGGAEPYIQEDSSVTGSDYCSSSSLGFSATVDITGYSVTFTPTTVAGANNGEYTGSTHLTNVVGISALEGSGLSGSVATMTFDRLSISGAGSYSLNTTDNVFDSGTGSASLMFYSSSITNADYGTQVGFESTSGSVTFTSWGTAIGDQLIGTYLANVSGDRVKSVDEDGNREHETLTGTISGSFNVEITTGN